MGHEAIGIVEEAGADVLRVRCGQLAVMPFAYLDGSCMFCNEGLNTSCVQRAWRRAGGGAAHPPR